MRTLLTFVFALCAALSFSSCSYSMNYKNYQDYQAHDDDNDVKNVKTRSSR